MLGGAGDDSYTVFGYGTVVEGAGAGLDRVAFTATAANRSYTLTDNVEHGSIEGASDGGAVTLRGNALDNFLAVTFGYRGNVILSGEGGNDWVFGELGNDTLFGGAGDDRVYGGLGYDTLYGGAGNDQLSVQAGGTAFGGAGNDLYYTAGDVAIFEGLNEGVDTVYFDTADEISSFTLGANIEHGVLLMESGASSLTGNGLNNALLGSGGDDLLRGLAGNDTLYGGTGNDTLDGGIGADTMSGCEGDDVFIVDSAYDRVLDFAGYDTVRASVSYTLGADIEALVLTGTAAINGAGNAAGNLMIGNDAANRLYGGGGSDRLSGGGGNDILDGGLESDQLEGGLGTDYLYGGAGDDALIGGEGVGYLYGGDGRDALAGGSTTDYLYGGTGSDSLSGGAGDDRLYGDADADRLQGGAGADLLYGGAGVDIYVLDADEGAGNVIFDDTLRDDILMVVGAGVSDGQDLALGEALGGVGSSVTVAGSGSALTIGLGAANMRVGAYIGEVVLFDTTGAPGSQYQHFIWDAADQRYEYAGTS
jgi:Ca2+-binding RTX toxin-like protein